MNLSMRKRLMDTIGWGFILWFIGFGLGMLLFPFVPVRLIGLPILGVMFPVTTLVAYRRLHDTGAAFSYYLLVAAVWVLVPIVFDYVFLVGAFNVQSYYDLDVMVYYLAAFLIPLAIGLRYGRSHTSGGRRESFGK